MINVSLCRALPLASPLAHFGYNMKSTISTLLTSLALLSTLTACALLPDSSEPELAAARASAEAGTSLALNGVWFDSEEASLDPRANEIVQRTVEFLRANPASTVMVEGHTDHLGPARYNQKLSESRAQVIVQALTQAGISASRITAVGYGESKPVADNATADGRRANRRVEIVLQNDAGAKIE